MIVSISPTNDILKINNKKHTVVIPTDEDSSNFDILIKNKLYLEDLYKYLHIYDISNGKLCKEYIEVILEIGSHIEDEFIDDILSHLTFAPILYPDSTQLPNSGNVTIPGSDVVYVYDSEYFEYEEKTLMIYKNTDNPNIIKVKAKYNIRKLLSRVVSKLSGYTLPDNLNNYTEGNNLIDMTLPEFIELYTTFFRSELSYDGVGNPYISSILSLYSFLISILNFKNLYTFNMVIPSDRSQSDKNVSRSLVWELQDSSFDSVYIANKNLAPTITDVLEDIENIKYKNNFILEKSDDGIVWYPILGIPYTSERSVNSKDIYISLGSVKTIPADTKVTNISSRYITIDTPTDYMTPENIEKYLYLSSIFVYDELGIKIPFTISDKHFTNAKKNGIILSDTELATLLIGDNINSCVKLETNDTISLTLDLGSAKTISKILIRVGDTSEADVTKYKYNVKCGLSLNNMRILYTYEDTMEPPGKITTTTPTKSISIVDPWALYTQPDDGESD